ncbi:MAG: DNA repair protein RecO [Solobacterium sp.]|nr:DNA repair protein RecO [Solobacterium sp.]
MNDKVEGIILKQSDYKDSSLLLQVLTKEYGKIMLVANGARKPTSKTASRLLPYTKNEFLFDYHEGKNMFRLKNLSLIQLYRNLHEDVEASLASGVIGELADVMTYEEYDYENVYQLIDEAFYLLNEDKRSDLIIGIVLSNLMKMNGIGANVDECTICQKKNVVAISAKDGGFLCASCAQSMHVQPRQVNELKEFRLLSKAQLEHYDILHNLIEDGHPYIDILVEILRLHHGISLNSYHVYQSLLPLKDAS